MIKFRCKAVLDKTAMIVALLYEVLSHILFPRIYTRPPYVYRKEAITINNPKYHHIHTINDTCTHILLMTIISGIYNYILLS